MGSVRCVSYGVHWYCDCTVSFAERIRVLFCGIRKTGMRARETATYEDENCKVDWTGSGYSTLPKSDGVNMGNTTFSSTKQEEAHLMQQYPRQASQ